MGTFTFHATTELDAPVEAVWDYVTTHDQWRQPFVASVEQIAGDGPQVGARYESTARMGPTTITLVNEIVTVEPPTRLQWKQISDGSVRTELGTYRLEDLGQGRTRFTVEHNTRTSGLMAPMSAVMPWFNDRVVAPRLLRQLREGVNASLSSD